MNALVLLLRTFLNVKIKCLMMYLSAFMEINKNLFNKSVSFSTSQQKNT